MGTLARRLRNSSRAKVPNLRNQNAGAETLGEFRYPSAIAAKTPTSCCSLTNEGVLLRMFRASGGC
jgi:hypothetical protein